jgi:hypothetical protein
VVSPSPPLRKSPKSPKESNDTSSEKLDERLNGSLREEAAESEKGPKPSSFGNGTKYEMKLSTLGSIKLTSSSSVEKGSLKGLSAGGGGKMFCGKTSASV